MVVSPPTTSDPTGSGTVCQIGMRVPLVTLRHTGRDSWHSVPHAGTVRSRDRAAGATPRAAGAQQAPHPPGDRRRDAPPRRRARASSTSPSSRSPPRPTSRPGPSSATSTRRRTRSSPTTPSGSRCSARRCESRPPSEGPLTAVRAVDPRRRRRPRGPPRADALQGRGSWRTTRRCAAAASR